jgi:NAD(P)-dependent dehydrogenase (short-subunit alcohol dehydrogenase family)
MARILITGCSTGIGRQSAITLAARGHEVVATARRMADIDSLVTEHQLAAGLALDVTDDEAVRAARDAAGDIDVVVNNAGFEVAGPVERVPLEEIRRMFEVNWFGVIRMVQAFTPAMRSRGHGVFVNVSSVAGQVSGPLNGFYAASKHALEALSDSMHYELRHFGIRTVIIEPGGIATNFQANIVHAGDDTAPYDELRSQWDNAAATLRGGADAPGPALVADAIADAIDDALAGGDGPRRIPVGDDANLAISASRAMDDAEFETTMRATLGIDW